MTLFRYLLIITSSQVKNALNNVCLAGSHYDSQRQDAISCIEDAGLKGILISNDKRVPISQLIVLLYQHKSLAFRGIYGISPICDEYLRIYGKGPRSLSKDIPIEAYMKYSSSSRCFTAIPTKSITSTVDAISIDPTKLKKS